MKKTELEHNHNHEHEHIHEHSHAHEHNHEHDHIHEHGHEYGHEHNHAAERAEGGSARKNILAAFLLNLFFIIIEVLGGLYTNSYAILSDAVHDAGDCMAIGLAWLLERRSGKAPEGAYTYGYRRYSVISALVTALVLVAGSVLVLTSSIERIMNPQEINAPGMTLIAILGVVINGAAMLKTRAGSGVNERTISLHMLEDVLGWVVVLAGSVFIRIFDLPIIDPILSVLVALFILYHAVKNVREVLSVLLEKAPAEFEEEALKKALSEDERILDLHHIHVWSLDGENLLATMHAVIPDGCSADEIRSIKEHIREECRHFRIGHVTIETDTPSENCTDCECEVHKLVSEGGHHHHHHH